MLQAKKYSSRVTEGFSCNKAKQLFFANNAVQTVTKVIPDWQTNTNAIS
jgi:hypothetical protein